MTKKTLIAVALVALATAALAGVAAAEKATTVKAGNLVFTINGKVTPKALPKSTFAPISLTAQGEIAAADQTHPPALIEAVIDTDKNGTIDARGVPTCKIGQLEARTTDEARKTCKAAIVGTGTTDVELQFPEQKAIPIHSQLTAFNSSGGGKGSATILIHAFLSNPVSAALVTTVKVKPHKSGRYGTRSVALVPKIANGQGSVTAFSLTFPQKLFAFKGKKHGYLLARCADGRFAAQAEAKFSDGTKIGPAAIQRTCTPKG
jgi:hypothetical protein